MSSFQDKINTEIISLLKGISEQFNIEYSQLFTFYTGEKIHINHHTVIETKKEIEPEITKLSPEKKKIKIEDLLIGKKKEETKEEPKKKTSPKKDIDIDALKSDPDLEPIKLNSYNLKELQGLCKRHSLKVSGKKDELLKRLSGKEGVEEETKTINKISPEKKVTKKQEVKEEKILEEKITSKTPLIDIRRNQFDNFMHTSSLLVFDKVTKEVIGKQLDDGSISDLTPDDIDECNKYKFNYRLPENLDRNQKGFDDIKVEELDEKEEEVEEDDIEYEYEEYQEEVEEEA